MLVNYAKTYFTGALPEVWLYALGALFVLVTLFLPRGLVGLCAAAIRSGAAPVALAIDHASAGRRARAPTPQHAALSRRLTVSFDGFKALNELSLYVDRASCAASSARTAPARRR